jgi:hypothetical protein
MVIVNYKRSRPLFGAFIEDSVFKKKWIKEILKLWKRSYSLKVLLDKEEIMGILGESRKNVSRY